MRALDLFAGTGWAVACRWLGIAEDGVDNMPEVIATRQKARLLTPWHDILDVPAKAAAAYDLLIASPPCQSFSIAGAGEGRRALDDVLAGVTDLEWGREPARTTDDPRTWLVLEPLRFALAGMPPYIAWEQVTTIQPVWDACAKVLRQRGYDVWTGPLRTEQYGIPQTRRRSILLARMDGRPARPPRVTHSQYYVHDPLMLDPGVLKWVSMREALNRGSDPITVMRSNYGTNGVAANRGERPDTHPAPTVTTKINRNMWINAISEPRRVSVLEAQMLQTYPPDFDFLGGSQIQYAQIGNAVPPKFGAALLATFLP